LISHDSLEILVYSTYLQCDELKYLSSEMVSNLLSVDNVLSILLLPELNNQNSLKRSCVQFISRNYNQFEEEDLNKLSDDVLFQIKQKMNVDEKRSLKKSNS
jgi:hypothetical protein